MAGWIGLLCLLAVVGYCSAELACPISQNPFLTIRTYRRWQCRYDAQCDVSEKCCYWRGIRHCVAAMDTAPKQGLCPSTTSDSNFLTTCKMDYGGCRFDSECEGDEKCCEVPDCGYKECSLLARSSPKENMECPTYPFYFDIPLSMPICKSDGDCKSDEKCCWWGSGKQCKTGVDTTPKTGTCPVSQHSANACLADYAGCKRDSECNGTEKCCRNSSCGYNECTAAV